MNVKIKNSTVRCATSRLREYARERGFKWTHQREAIATLFLSRKSHVSVEELHDEVKKQHPRVGHSTVYRTVRLIVSAGLGSERRFQADASVFEPQLAGEHHDHLVCVRCGRIIEFENKKIEELQREVADANGFETTDHRLTLFGLCHECKQKRRAVRHEKRQPGRDGIR